MLQLPGVRHRRPQHRRALGVVKRDRAPASAPPPVTVGVLSLVTLSLLRCRCQTPRSGPALGAAATVSMVTASAADATLVLPATSVCVAVRLWTPSESGER